MLEYKEESLASESESPDQAAKPVHVEVGEIVAPHGMSKGSIQRVLDKHMPSINLCYEYVSGKKSNLQGVLTFKLLIDSKGKVVSVHVDRKSKKNMNLEQCIVQKLRKLNFPAPQAGKNVEVSVSFVLK